MLFRIYCMITYVIIVLFVVLFFFFKQKTAYEMRISDWSSDVCSSDLFVRSRLFLRNHACGDSVDFPRASSGGLRAGIELLANDGQGGPEIGRASCRERVC